MERDLTSESTLIGHLPANSGIAAKSLHFAFSEPPYYDIIKSSGIFVVEDALWT